ncbi:type II secretion system protein [Ruficoccus sp. ZRK36]|uniref:type II secretion system protein n=1 Tax=Ruficoccus sp. ZRK36 TaxID=2866311 RepID=UPI001C72B98D|nr:type II secretion system protein [Ruficoccus sp. ZRK36]QYY37406.1 type II secretion system GspH family protein [Ruficoccus sp. ZRK36]
MLSTRRYPLWRGFTLIELLAVIAIMAVLMAILIPMGRSVRAAADDAGCASNLRQIGTAVQLYVNENSGYLPGPSWSAISVQYSPRADIQNTTYGIRYNLFTHLVPYLSHLSQTGARTYEELACPGWRREATDLTKPCYIAQDTLRDSKGVTFRPWGNAGSGEAPSESVYQIESPSSTWAIRDVDKGNFSNTSSSYYSSLPDRPVHGDHRNVLYFDWHVGSVDAD